jgi:MFS family permease
MGSFMSNPEIGPDLETSPTRWWALGVLTTASLLEMTTWFSAAAVLPQLHSAWKLTPGVGALLTISVQLGFVAGCLISAVLNLADLISPRRLMLLGGFAAAGVNAALLVSAGPASALPLRFLTGASLALVYPPALKVMSTWFRRGRGAALGVMVGGLTLGSAMPYLLNGLGGIEWRRVIVHTSLLTVAGGILAEFIGSDGPFPFPRAVFDPRQAARAFANRGVRLATLGYFGHMWELYAMWTWFAAFFADVLARRDAIFSTNAPAEAAIGTFAVIGIGGFGCAAGGWLGDRWGRTRTAALSLVISGACALVIGASALSALAVLLIGLVWGFSVVADSAQFSTMVTETADQSYVGTALTLQLAVGFTLTVATIWLVPVLRESVGWYWSLAMLALGPAGGILAMLRLMRAPEAAKIAGGKG